jgi:membrane protease YdiL (CAAX protease family)
MGAAGLWIEALILVGLFLLWLLRRSQEFRQGLLPATHLPLSHLTESDAVIAFGLILVAVGSLQGGMYALDAYTGGNGWRQAPSVRLLLGISPTGLGALIVLAVSALRNPTATRALGLRSAEPAKDLGRGLAVYVAAYPGVIGVILLWGAILSRLGVKVQPQEVVNILLARQPRLEVAASVAVAILVAPLFEEMIFRGFLLPAFSRRLGAPGAVALAATLFGLLHGRAYAGPIFALGLLLGWLYWRTGRLWIAVGCHGAHNAAALVAAWLSLSQSGTPGAP